MGWFSEVDFEGRTIWIADAHGYGQRFIVRADEKLTAFVELERAIHEFAVDLMKSPRRNVQADEKLTAFLDLESAVRAVGL